MSKYRYDLYLLELDGGECYKIQRTDTLSGKTVCGSGFTLAQYGADVYSFESTWAKLSYFESATLVYSSGDLTEIREYIEDLILIEELKK